MHEDLGTWTVSLVHPCTVVFYSQVTSAAHTPKLPWKTTPHSEASRRNRWIALLPHTLLTTETSHVLELCNLF